MKLVRSIKLATSITLPLITGFLGSLATTPAIPTWYANLNKPWFSPPNWLFAPVWTLLYLFMGISLYLIWQSRVGETRKKAMILFFIQLTLNFLWSMLFFALKQPLLALIDIFLLCGTITWLIKQTLPLNRPAAYLLLPYLAWVSFATLLNLAITLLN